MAIGIAARQRRQWWQHILKVWLHVNLSQIQQLEFVKHRMGSSELESFQSIRIVYRKRDQVIHTALADQRKQGDEWNNKDEYQSQESDGKGFRPYHIQIVPA